MALRQRIGLFSRYVGKLQPILSTLSQRITSIVLSSKEQRQAHQNQLVNELETATENDDAFDIDEVTEADLEEIPLEPTLYDMKSLDLLINRPDLLPPGIEVELMQKQEYRYSLAGMSYALRVTTDPEYYDLHSSSTELWSPGNLLFPNVPEADSHQVPTDLNTLL